MFLRQAALRGFVRCQQARSVVTSKQHSLVKPSFLRNNSKTIRAFSSEAPKEAPKEAKDAPKAEESSSTGKIDTKRGIAATAVFAVLMYLTLFDNEDGSGKLPGQTQEEEKKE